MFENRSDEELVLQAQALDYLISTEGIENVRATQVLEFKTINEELRQRGWKPLSTIVYSSN
jgi:hypothetical protein